MTQEQRQDAPVAEPQAIEPPPAEESVEALRATLGEAQKKLAETEKGLRTARSTITEKDKALKEAQNLQELVKGLGSRLDTHEAILKTFDNRDDEVYEEDKPKKPSIEQALNALTKKQTDERFRVLARETDEKVKEAGLDMQTSPELKLALKMFTQYGDPDGGYKEALRIVEAKMAEKETPKGDEPPVKTVEEQAQEMAEKMYQARVAKEPGLKPEGGVPAGSSSDESFWKDWGEGKIEATPENLKKAMEIQRNRS